MPLKSNNKWLLWLTAVACLLSLVVFSFLLFQSSQTTKLAKADGYSPDQIIVAINKERVKNSLKPLIVNNKLTIAAQNKVKDMADKSYFSHISPVDGKKWSGFIKDAGYVYLEAGENLANGYDSVETMVEAWMNSPTHRDNILNPNFIETGMALEYGTLNNYPTIFVAESFGRREVQESVPQVNNQTKETAPEVSSKSVTPVVEKLPEKIPEPKKFSSANTLLEVVAPFPPLETAIK